MNDKDIKVSVLMAVYNTPRQYLDESIQSILAQTLADFEFLIIDDGSDEATSIVLRKHAERDSRIRLHSLPSNIGLTKALNTGLRLVRGDFIARQDADDVSHPERLEETCRFLEDNPEFSAAGTNVQLMGPNGQKTGAMIIDPSLKKMSRRNVLVHGSMMFRREVFESVGNYNEKMRLSQDYELYLRMTRLHGLRLGVVPRTLYCLRQHADSLSSRRIFRQFFFSVLAKFLTLPGKMNVWRRRMFFAKELVLDLLITHRLLVGPILRSYFSDDNFADRPVTLKDMKSSYKPVFACRICGNENLVQVLDLGQQYLTGVFPKTSDAASLTKGPLQLVKCHGGADVCGLLQLRHTYDSEEMYGDNYGYRSGLNKSMIAHLHRKIDAIIERMKLLPGDLVIDIGSNDGTSLSAYPSHLTLVGIDPVGKKFQQYYTSHVTLIPALFSASLVNDFFPDKKAKVITSFSMVYDLEDPLTFVREIASLLDAESGIWVFEQSYMPLMLERMAFDTICHEHIEYYGLKQIQWLLDRADLKIIDVEFNDVNGGSFSVVASRMSACHRQASNVVTDILRREEALGIDVLATYADFSTHIEAACTALKQFLANAKEEGKRVCGIGASTKGNVILQYCGLTSADIEVIGEVNPDKFGSLTPGTWIPIEDEVKVLASEPDYLLVLPWHFRGGFLNNPAYKGRQLVFPLPSLEIVRA